MGVLIWSVRLMGEVIWSVRLMSEVIWSVRLWSPEDHEKTHCQEHKYVEKSQILFASKVLKYR